MASVPERDADLLQEVYSTGHLVGLLVDRELAAAGVSDELFSFLGWITRLEPVTPGNLAAETGMPATTIRDYVRRLVERGDVRREPNPSDGRSYFLVLTPKGRRRSHDGWPAVLAAYERIARHLERPPADHLARSRELRRAVQQALDETESRPQTAARPASTS